MAGMDAPPSTDLSRLALTTFRGCSSDRNERGMQGTVLLGRAIGERAGIECTMIGTASAPPTARNWDRVLETARPGLLELATAYRQLMSTQRVPITTFARCACALATLPVIARHRPDAVIVYFDAHGDVNTPATSATGYLGGLVISGAAGMWDSGLGDGLALANVVLVGARDLDPFERELIESGRLRNVTPGPRIAERLAAAIGSAPVYIHIDCDVMDPGIVPTEYTVPGGLSLADLRAICERLARNEIVGVEIAELEASWNDTGEPAFIEPLLDALQPLWSARRNA
jgi:arginase family enzyme